MNMNSFEITVMSDRTFSRFSEFIHSELGIKMPGSKKIMLQSRLHKRMRSLDIKSFDDYYDYVFNSSAKQEELTHMVNVVTTNKTDFFREPKQFDYLAQTALGETICNEKRALRKSLLVWSAGCSTGEEPYTLAMVVANFMDGKQNGNYSILATDISTRVLGVAKEATYAEAEVAPVPLTLKKKYLMRGKGPQKGFARIVPSLRKRVSFQRLNLNKGNHFGIRTPMDIIFCRNVIIYFDRKTQTKLFEKFYAQLAPGGYMFIGHSETLTGINDAFLGVGPSIYRKPG